ncbi:replication factor C [Theileria orientalis strain Shintoku]|uniref:Replication factor C n=1 Tax=Theileria orientalis strain Shintoku TaxID=869250 RepID=J4C949_THEOR|nr:replication factor C [Theileria orientalis strain Shintoku]BAM41918.1 replication factor C [Theileria orientalis strain Shintoku]|eukprot:XP_009692219.1 replication factor C [Theileria orientalis strain Shintoku]
MDDNDTFDILNEIYGDDFSDDFSFDFVNKNQDKKVDSKPESHKKEPTEYTYAHSTSFQKPLEFYPLSPFPSYGYSCLDLLDLARIFNPSGSDYFNIDRTQYHQMCRNDKSKLFKLNEKLENGESFAIKSSTYSTVNPPVYMKYYRSNESESDSAESSSLISEPIDRLFKRIYKMKHDEYEDEDVFTGRIIKKRKKKRREVSESRKENWVTKYKPEYFSDLLTRENANLECLRWLSSWKCSSNYLSKYKEPENKILLIGGPSGVGKTCLVQVLGRHCGYNIVEINSSDDRTKGRVIPIINGVVSAGSVDPKRPNLCLLEDVDTLHGQELSIITHLKQINSKKGPKGNFIKRPIICTCTDVYARNLKELREISKVVMIESCDNVLLKSRLESIMEEEGVFIPEEYLKEIQETYKDDIRSCLTVLEFISNYSGKHGSFSISDLTKDTNEGVEKLLKTVFNNDIASKEKMETLLLSTTSSIGYNYVASVIGENATTLPMKRHDHLWKIAIFEDIIAQSDAVCNTYASNQQSIQLLKVCCSFLNRYVCNRTFISHKLTYPQKTSFFGYNMKYNKSKNIIHTLQKSTTPIIAQGIVSRNFTQETLPFILQFMSNANRALNNQSYPTLLRVIKGTLIVVVIQSLDGCWEGLFPYGSTKLPLSVYPLFHLAQIVVSYGMSIVNVNHHMVFDPPVFELYLKTDDQDYFYRIQDKFSQMLVNFVDFYRTGNKSHFTDDSHFKGASHFKTNKFTNLTEAVKYIYNEGFEVFKKLNETTEKVNKVKYNEVVCKRTHEHVFPVLLSQIIHKDSLELKEYSSKKRIISKTFGNYKYKDQNCSAVRYIINQL